MFRSKITSHINPAETALVAAFLDHAEACSYEQCPAFARTVYGRQLRYYFQYEGEQLYAFCIIRRRKFFFTEILFGPVVREPQQYEPVIRDLLRLLRKRGILLLRLMPPAIIGGHPDMRFTSSPSQFNWSTLLLDIKNKSSEELFRSFADRHRGSIKKALKNNLSVSAITGQDDLDIFSANYILMYQGRSLPVDPDTEQEKFRQLFACFQQHRNGFFLAVTNEQGQQIGGCCMVMQGKTAHYYKGYVHPGFRSLPVSHLALFRAMERAVAENRDVFDFGGYALNTLPGDQLHHINLFKAGFGGRKTDYPLTRIYYLNGLVKILFPFVAAMRKKWIGGGHEN